MTKKTDRAAKLFAALLLLLQVCPAQSPQPAAPAQTPAPAKQSAGAEYLWYEAENMRGFSTDKLNNPLINASWVNPSRLQSPGWGMNGPGVSAEWTQGGESEWNSAAASADETRASLQQEVQVPRAGQYRLWVRYADWAGKTENFGAWVAQGGRVVARSEFGARDLVDAHDETAMYWGWAFAWDSAPPVQLEKGSAVVSFEIERAAQARRHVDCFLLTNDADFTPEGRRKPEFAAQRVLREQAQRATSLEPLVAADASGAVPQAWRRPLLAGRDFLLPWNISPAFWAQLDEPPAERSLYPFHAETPEQFVEKYKGAKEVPVFSSPLVVPVVHLNELPALLKEGTPFLRHLRETRAPFAVNINYSSATFTEADGQAAWKLLTGELKDQFLGWISGENVGYVWDPQAVAALNLTAKMPRRQLLEANRKYFTGALERKWGGLFHTPQTGAMWDKLIAAQATSSTYFAHALARWGAKTVGMETAAVMPNVAMRIAFARGAARQYGATFLYYHAANFGDTATSFTRQQNFAGPDNFYHSRYGATMGPSLSWYRKSYYLYYMAGASAIYLEQGFDQFFKPGPGEHPFQLNPLGRISDEFVRFADRHKDRGTPYTPVAFLLDPAHGWDQTDYPQWSYGVVPQERRDRALRELFGAAYYPALVTEGEPATADRQAYVNGIFGDIFDVVVASDERREAIDSYRAVVVGGHVEWSPAWIAQLREYVRKGGVLVLNAAQVTGLPEDLLGVRLSGAGAEGDDAECAAPNDAGVDLRGAVFRFERVEPRGAQVLMKTRAGEPLVTVNKIGGGRVVFSAVPDLLGLDERLTPTGAHLLAHLAADAVPVQINGDVQRLVNRTERGWVVTLVNNRGVYKPQQGMAQVNRAESAEVTISLRGKGIALAREWTSEQALEVAGAGAQGLVKVRVPPGDVRVVEIVARGN
ncbi:MAG: hypothetical protein LC785_08390 [Acidobacteria bacterium]|nr:hypothetical protein [Acidobacteriota bacterium]MCA1641952.1 hypothetical protein [Acidobacteriota bacterium]